MNLRFEMKREILPVEALFARKPDHNWKFVDGEGHLHAWVKNELPTLEWMVDVPECGDYPEIGHYECKQCREEVEPKTVSDCTRRHVPGYTEYALHLDNCILLEHTMCKTPAHETTRHNLSVLIQEKDIENIKRFICGGDKNESRRGGGLNEESNI